VRLATAIICACLVGCCCLPVEGGQRTQTVECSADTEIDEDNPTTNKASQQIIYWAASLTNHRTSPLFRFAIPSLNTGESLDSAQVVVDLLGTVLVQSEYWGFEVIAEPTYTETTWNKRNSGADWDSAGAWGTDTDIERSTNYGYGADGRIMVGENPITPGEGETPWPLYRGSAFNAFVSANLGETVDLIIHDPETHTPPEGDLYIAAVDHSTATAPYLKLWINTNIGKRRRDMLTEPGR
jgi:hypothetical protein